MHEFLQDLQESSTKTDIHLDVSWKADARFKFYWNLNLRRDLRTLKSFSARKIFICCRYVILLISAVESRNGANTSGCITGHPDALPIIQPSLYSLTTCQTEILRHDYAFIIAKYMYLAIYHLQI